VTDRDAIVDVLVRYATGIDTRDWALFRTCFTEKCHADYGDIGVWDGVDAITEFMTVSHADMGHTLHRMTNMAITVNGDGATSRSYVDALLMMGDGKTAISAQGFYDDELVRAGDGWRIARRTFTTVRIGMIGG